MTINNVSDRLVKWIAMIIIIVSIFGCGSGAKDPKPDAAGSNVIPVEIAVAQRQSISAAKTFSASLEGEEQANIVAKISERVTSINVRVGQNANAGQVILTLDKSGVQSQYYQVEAGYKNAAKTLERMKSLYQEGAISLQSLDGAQTAYDVAKANFDAARSAVELTTPIDGVVTAVNVSIGDLANPGTVLATTAKVNRIKAIININETDVTNLAIGQKVQIFSEARPETIVEGRIIQLSNSADPKSRTFEVRALFQNTPDRWFKPGMFCRVNVQVSPRSKTLVIPNAAIQSDGVNNRVFVVHGGRSYQQNVQVGVTDSARSEVLRGLNEGDSIVTIGATNTRDSGYVSIVRQSN
jgi:membrane fusion protein (multidrug efflux system)